MHAIKNRCLSYQLRLYVFYDSLVPELMPGIDWRIFTDVQFDKRLLFRDKYDVFSFVMCEAGRLTVDGSAVPQVASPPGKPGMDTAFHRSSAVG